MEGIKAPLIFTTVMVLLVNLPYGIAIVTVIMGVMCLIGVVALCGFLDGR